MTIHYQNTLAIVNKNNQLKICYAVVACLITTFFDVLGHAPNLTSLLAMTGFAWLFIIVAMHVAKKNPFRTLLPKLATPFILIGSYAFCVLLGIGFQNMALREAENLRQQLIKQLPSSTLYQAYANICSSEPSKTCGFSSYKILPIEGTRTGDVGHLSVMQFFNHRAMVDLRSSVVSQNSREY